MPETDIVVPIYNALPLVKACVASVLRHTRGDYRLILVDDKSPDPEMAPYLEALATQESSVLVLRNEVNQGFIGAANRGMQRAIDDGSSYVCLLNSDVEVTAGWLDKMLACLNRDENIATVSPLSNNATLCSVPVGMVDNPLPDGFDLDSFAAFVETHSQRLYPEVPSTVGFCLMIRGELLARIGLFDGETFGRGYCEENDLCLRASREGMVHCLDDATYVYHHGRASFGAETFDAFAANYRALCRRYPEYPDDIQRLIQLDTLSEMRKNIVEALAQHYDLSGQQERPNILYLIHNDPFGKTIGGTTFHLRDVVDHLKGFNAWVLSPTKTGMKLSRCVAGAPLCSEVDCQGESDEDWDQAMNALLGEKIFDAVHIHHLMDFPKAVLENLQRREWPMVLTLHDYWMACPRYTLINHTGSYCGVPRDPQACHSCLDASPVTRGQDIESYRQRSAEVFESCQWLIVPSDAAGDTVALAFPQVRSKIKTIEHGMHWRAFGLAKGPRPRATPKNKNRLRVGILGYLAPQKGLKVVQQAIALNRNPLVEWHLLGGELRHLKIPSSFVGHIMAHGRYTRENVVDLLRYHEIDVTLIPSIWPETFGYTLSESWAAGVPAIVSHFGALGERVQKTGAGWVIDPEDPNALLGLIETLVASPEKLEGARARVDELSWVSISENAGLYANLYRGLLETERS